MVALAAEAVFQEAGNKLSYWLYDRFFAVDKYEIITNITGYKEIMRKGVGK